MDYLKVREAALRYQLSEKTIRKWITTKQLPSITRVVNGVEQYALLPEDIEKLIAEKSLEPKSPALVELAEGLQTATSGHLDTSSPGGKEQITALAGELSYQSELLEALKLEVESLKSGQASLQQELEDLRMHVTALERKSKPVRRAVADVNYSVPQSVQPAETEPSRQPKQRVQTPATTTSTRPLLPDGWSSWTPFIERHGISSERRPLKVIDRESFCEPGEYMQKLEGSAQRVKCALSPSGQARLLEAIKALPIGGELRQCDVQACPCHQIVEAQGTLW